MKLKFDGGSRGNPGKSGCGYVLYDDNNNIIHTGYKYLGIQTNNYAEYMGLICGLELAILHNITRLSIEGDSLLIINQMKKIYKVKNKNILSLYSRATILLQSFSSITFNHIYREFNSDADKLANYAIDNSFSS